MEHHVGHILNKLRKSKSLTLDQLSQNSGVSKSMLSQIESGKTNPTLAILIKISQGLQIPIQTIVAQLESYDSAHVPTIYQKSPSLEEKDHPELRMFKRSFQLPKLLDVDIPGVHFSVFTPLDMAQKLEVYQIIFSPNAVLFSKGHGKNVLELITVLEGSFHIETPEGTMNLDPGDFACYPASDVHVIKNQGNLPGKVHLIVQFP
jgi:transcriptional regulator with XRE-family HTH domain